MSFLSIWRSILAYMVTGQSESYLKSGEPQQHKLWVFKDPAYPVTKWHWKEDLFMADLGKQQVVNKRKKKSHVATSLKHTMEFAIKAIFWKANNNYVVKYVIGKIQTPVSTCKVKHICFLSPSMKDSMKPRVQDVNTGPNLSFTGFILSFTSTAMTMFWLSPNFAHSPH